MNRDALVLRRQPSRLTTHTGNGWAFPVRPTMTRALLFQDGPNLIAQSITLILMTQPGERVMRPDFGCNLRQFLMQPNTVATQALIQREVELALTTWEPRIQLTEVEVDAGDDPALVWIRITFEHRRDRRPDNLVFPLYLE